MIFFLHFCNLPVSVPVSYTVVRSSLLLQRVYALSRATEKSPFLFYRTETQDGGRV